MFQHHCSRFTQVTWWSQQVQEKPLDTAGMAFYLLPTHYHSRHASNK